MLGVDPAVMDLLFVTAALVFCLFVFIMGLRSPSRRSQRRKEDTSEPYLIPRTVVAQKAAQTRKQLESLAKIDPAMNPERLLQKVRSTLSDIQKRLEDPNHAPRENGIYESIFYDQLSAIQSALRDSGIHQGVALIINWIEIIHFRYPRNSDEEDRTFTALIEARFPNSLVRYPGSPFPADSPATFQEFWSFLWKEKNADWSLWGTELPLESSALTEENFDVA